MPLPPRPRRVLAALLIAGTSACLFGATWMVADLVRRSATMRAHPAPRTGAALGRRSADCRSCHQDIYADWAASHHAHANRPVDPVADAPAFQPARSFSCNGTDYQVAWADGKPTLNAQPTGGVARTDPAAFVLGYTPLRQYVVPVGHGRYQATEVAFDPAKREWFSVLGTEPRRPGEWGHWTGRGMNWNSMCAHCHLTDYAKGYRAETDTYASTWLEHGVGCIQCHDNLSADHGQPGYRPTPERRARARDAARNQETCAPCHARNELLAGEPRPGMAYFDHFRLVLPVDRATFYPDGQVHDEDFNWTSFLTSRMGGKAGVTCLDCHDPHRGKTRLPSNNNALCQQCHGTPNPKHAPLIDPLAHSHHQPGSAGNQCVACHMPTTTYMQRDPRHDHGFLKPDPLLTKELGIPNACDRCHADKGIAWQIEASDRWYGAKLESRQRRRAQAVDAAQHHRPGSAARLVELIASEDIPAWKATFLQLLQYSGDLPEVRRAAEAALSNSNPLVRSAAVQVLATSQAPTAPVRAALRDPSRLVRLDAEWALAPELAPGSRERQELDESLAFNADQPSGQLRIGQDLAARGRLPEAVAALRKAIQWDPNSAGIHETLGVVLDRQGDAMGAAAELWRAAQLDATNAPSALQAGLAFAAAGDTGQAEAALREAVRRDPDLHRAWYNLGLLLSQTGRTADALTALKRAETLAPDVADYPYAAATVLWSAGRRDEARQAAQRALAADPNHAGARRLLSAR